MWFRFQWKNFLLQKTGNNRKLLIVSTMNAKTVSLLSFQIENEVDTEVFECKTGGRRSSASTNNNNTAPSDPGSPKTVRSRYTNDHDAASVTNIFSYIFNSDSSSESTDHERQRDRNGERPTTMSGSAIAWELFLWFSCRLSKIIEFRTTGLSQSVIIDTASAASHNFIQSSSAKLKTIDCGSRYETANNSTASITSRGLVRYSVLILVPLSAIAAAVFCKCSKNGASDV